MHLFPQNRSEKCLCFGIGYETTFTAFPGAYCQCKRHHQCHHYGDKTRFLEGWLGSDNIQLSLRRLIKERSYFNAKLEALELHHIFFLEGGGHTEDLPTSSDELAKPSVRAWATISFVMVQDSFKKCGIPNAIDGTVNNVLWFINVMTMYIKREYSFIL